uniref:Ig-like domain-containing protein n=1 Tax=Lates calcarifer TaxID=8187 RepID=A0A4W6CLX3_LATCA
MAADLDQHQLSLTRRVGQSVSFSCGQTNQCGGGYLFWYQKKDKETFKAILRIKTGDTPEKPFNHPQQNDFTAERTQSSSELKIATVKVSHSASYYCSCYSSHKRTEPGFGKRVDTVNEDVVKPVVSVYPAASRAHLGGKTSLLCLASGMFPPLVQFSWERQDSSSDKGEQLDLRGQTASILLVDRDAFDTNKYHSQQIPITQLSLHCSD